MSVKIYASENSVMTFGRVIDMKHRKSRWWLSQDKFVLLDGRNCHDFVSHWKCHIIIA